MDLRPPVADQWLRSIAPNSTPISFACFITDLPKKKNVQKKQSQFPWSRCKAGVHHVDWTGVTTTITCSRWLLLRTRLKNLQGQGGPSNERLLRRQLLRRHGEQPGPHLAAGRGHGPAPATWRWRSPTSCTAAAHPGDERGPVPPCPGCDATRPWLIANTVSLKNGSLYRNYSPFLLY